MKILVMGASGMLGHMLYSELRQRHQVWGTVREHKWHPDLLSDYDVSNPQKIEALIADKKPDFVINCIGIIKQLKASEDKHLSLEVNAIWPHRLALMCEKHGAKMIHFSTDCVFAGTKGNYTESDFADARDTYGLSKYMGEVDAPNALTLRTSIIGHELNTNHSLVDWFLSQKGECRGFSKAIFSGFPTITVVQFLESHVLPSFFSGVYNFSSDPVNKYDLLRLLAEQYQKPITIHRYEDFQIDRSLNSDRLRKLTGFSPAPWPVMIKQMYQNFVGLRETRQREIAI